MANQNFVVQNGLTVGPTTIDAASGNITMPVTKGIYIGNVLLRDNGDGKLHVRDRTDNSDVTIVATLQATSVTEGNIQIGTNHIESVNPDGPISIRPNGSGNIALSSNTIMFGHGGAYTTIGTGIQTDPAYGINYPGSNVIMTLSSLNAMGNLRLSMTTPSISTASGALQVIGGVGIQGNLNLGDGTLQGGTHTVQGNVVPFSSNTYTLGTSTNWWSKTWSVSVNAQYADLAENYVADQAYEPGTVLHFGGVHEVTQCDTDMCTKVAGVVSTDPAYLMNATQVGEHIVPLALTGRVPTKVTGSVSKGDLMVSAGNGRARAEANPRVGSVIGKALENSEGDAVIEVVVGKH